MAFGGKNTSSKCLRAKSTGIRTASASDTNGVGTAFDSVCGYDDART